MIINICMCCFILSVHDVKHRVLQKTTDLLPTDMPTVKVDKIGYCVLLCLCIAYNIFH